MVLGEAMPKAPRANSVLTFSILAFAPVSTILFYVLAKLEWVAINLTNLILVMSWTVICLIVFCILLRRR